jgi:hypothetical protein
MRLQTQSSSECPKTGILPVGANTDKLQQLRPVSFHLKTDPNGAVQYGLIAEEVDNAYPELVIRDDSGKTQGVRYDELAPMLLNEVQRQAEEIRAFKLQRQGVVAMQRQMVEMRAALLKLQPKDQLVAQR